jgi:hypothetical protein
MSSGPVGLDVREYVYGYFSFVLQVDGFYDISARKSWLVTKVQFYPAAVQGQIALNPLATTTVAPGGCLILEPNGAHKDSIQALGVGALVLIEYWFQAQAGQFVQSLPIDLVVPP